MGRPGGHVFSSVAGHAVLRLALAVGVLATTAVLVGGPASQLVAGITASSGPPPPLNCYQPTAPYAYGATDVDAEAGNSALTALFDQAGTLTVLRSLAANEDNQVNFFASGYDAQTGAAIPSQPNDGAFIGLRYVEDGTPHFTWLRDHASGQSYVPGDAPVVVTTYAPVDGLSVTDTAYATAGPLHLLQPSLATTGPDALVQHLSVTRAPGSSASDVELVAYGNWNPTATQVPYVPLADSGCSSGVNSAKVAAYDAGQQAVVASWSGADASTARPAGSAVAFGWAQGTSSWQVGGDSTDPLTPPTDPADPYSELSSSPFALGDATASVGQTTGAVATDPLFALPAGAAPGEAEVTLLTTVGSDADEALASLGAEKALVSSPQAYEAQLAQTASAWATLLAHAPSPGPGASAGTVTVARRALVVALLAVDPVSGAVVAAPDTQGPYAEDWIRDGAFIDHMLDENGFHDLVTRHELFYVRTQSSPTHPVPTVPFGNWPMVMYPSGGGPGGPIPYEIDETGYGAWTLWDHYQYLPADEQAQYLRTVYPAIALAADWLTVCKDPTNGFQCPASEDDNYTPTQTLHGALPDLLALRSALAAAGALGIPATSPQVSAWSARAKELDSAIGGLYVASAGAFRESPSSTGSPLPVSYEDGGLMLWPAQLQSYTTSQMQGEAAATLASMDASFSSKSGAYEGVALLGLCHASSSLSSAERSELPGALADIMQYTTTPVTRLFGEFWERWGNGTIGPVNDMPHTWEGALFDMAALCLYPPSSATGSPGR